jgi:DNA-binding NtrC family response regulator
MATVLLVDDDDAIRGAVDDWLSTAGFDVVSAPDASAALRGLEAHPEIDLCLVDLVMPSTGPDGITLVHSIRSERPNMPMILMTGYYSAAERIGDMNLTLLYKPVALDVLVEEIKRLLPM